MWTSLDAPSDMDYFGYGDEPELDQCPVCGAVDDEPHRKGCRLMRRRSDAA